MDTEMIVNTVAPGIAAPDTVLLFRGIFIACIIIGALAGVGIAAYRLMKKESADDPNSYAYLIKHQKVLDVVDAHSVRDWFEKNSALATGSAVFFLAKPSAKTSKMFALDRAPVSLDAKHTILQCVVDDSTRLPVAIRLISFSKINEAVSAQLDADGYVILPSQR